MKILAISEHFLPRVGGTVEYVVKTCEALQAAGHDVHLLVPGDGSEVSTIDGHAFGVTSLGCGWPAHGDPSREARYGFCRMANEHAMRVVRAGGADLVHVLFGLFVNETLDTAALRAVGARCVTTIHNIPPQECSRSWPGDGMVQRWKDRLRLKLVAVKNHSRLRAHDYDLWVTPSCCVADELRALRPGARVESVAHGCSDPLLDLIEVPPCRAPQPGEPLRLLTVGGWVPHKRQHLIPAVAAALRDQGIAIEWNLVGPDKRVPRYHQAIVDDIARRGLSDIVRACGAVPFDELARHYERAHLYVQPSTEEGFCMTALDAAAAGLPVIGSPAGALPEICRISEGALVPSTVPDLTHAITHFQRAALWPQDAQKVAQAVRKRFTWDRAAGELTGLL